MTDTKINLNIHEVIDSAITNNGGTFFYDELTNTFVNTDTVHTDGYYVAAHGKFEVQTQNLFPNEIINMVHTYGLYGGKRNRYLGLWFNIDNNTWYMDISHHFTNQWDALIVGKRNEQIAIWDIANRAEIMVED